MITNKHIPQTVDEYIHGFEGNVLDALKLMRATILNVVPEATESISYGMPAYKFHGVLVYFAGYKHHIGFYATPSGHKEFQQELSMYKQGKGSVQFPIDEQLPVSLIERMVRFRANENLAKAKK